MTIAPCPFRWDGEAMRPLSLTLARQFVVGNNYRLAVVDDRSVASHRQYFAAVNDAWRNLPEAYAQEFATPDHLRKWALIKAGFSDQSKIAVRSADDANRVAAFVAAIDGFSVVTVEAKIGVVTRTTAKSQSLRAMGKAEFQASKTAVLDILADMLGTTAAELTANAEDVA